MKKFIFCLLLCFVLVTAQEKETEQSLTIIDEDKNETIKHETDSSKSDKNKTEIVYDTDATTQGGESSEPEVDLTPQNKITQVKSENTTEAEKDYNNEQSENYYEGNKNTAAEKDGPAQTHKVEQSDDNVQEIRNETAHTGQRTKKYNQTNNKNEKKLKYLDEENKKIDYNYYKDFNLTDELEREYQETYQDDKFGDYYKDVENVGKADDLTKVSEKKQKKKDSKRKRKSQREQQEEQEKKDWDLKMENFHPENLLTALIDEYSQETFYQEINDVPRYLALAYYVHDEGKKIDFEVLNPQGNRVKRIKNRGYGYYVVKANITGVYKIILDNERVTLFNFSTKIRKRQRLRLTQARTRKNGFPASIWKAFLKKSRGLMLK